MNEYMLRSGIGSGLVSAAGCSDVMEGVMEGVMEYKGLALYESYAVARGLNSRFKVGRKCTSCLELGWFKYWLINKQMCQWLRLCIVSFLLAEFQLPWSGTYVVCRVTSVSTRTAYLR